jgi:hypothetical protein
MKKPLKYNKKYRRKSSSEKIKDKIRYQIRKITKKYPKIKQKIKNIKDLEKKLYYAMVWEVTELQPYYNLENSDKRGWKNYHLDHICSISVGYHNNISPELIGNIKNLQFLHYKENIDKGYKVKPHILKEMLKKSKKY